MGQTQDYKYDSKVSLVHNTVDRPESNTKQKYIMNICRLFTSSVIVSGALQLAMSDPGSQVKPRTELEVRVQSLPAAQSRDGASGSKDASASSATPQGAAAVNSGPTATRRRLGDGGPPAVVHVFSGPDDRVDGLAAYLSKLGVPCIDLDIVF